VAVAPGKNNFNLYTSDVAEYQGAFVLGDVTCVQAKIDLLRCGVIPHTHMYFGLQAVHKGTWGLSDEFDETGVSNGRVLSPHQVNISLSLSLSNGRGRNSCNKLSHLLSLRPNSLEFMILPDGGAACSVIVSTPVYNLQGGGVVSVSTTLVPRGGPGFEFRCLGCS
jgi:hypothetical protein